MRKAAAKKIQALEDKIDALQNKQSEIRSKEWEHEKAEEERKWKRDNASCIKFCKGLLGKVFTFGDFKSVIRHQVDKDKGVVIREYDYVSLYYATIISYRDKSRVCMSVRHMYAGDQYGSMDIQQDLFISLEKHGDNWYADECGRGSLGKVHVLTEQEMDEAFSFWEKRMSELGRTAFINPENNRWVCPVHGG